MQSDRHLRLLMIAPNRKLAAEVRSRLEEEAGFDVVGDLESHPGVERIPVLFAHFRPDCLLLDVSDLLKAFQLLSAFQNDQPACPVVALAGEHHAEVVTDLLRAGAFDYLESPFPASTCREVLLRVRRQVTYRSPKAEQKEGRVIGFTSMKPGSGATTLATQTAWALRRLTARPTLLVDLNIAAGISGISVGRDTRLTSILDAIHNLRELDESSGWEDFTQQNSGITMLPAPVLPEPEAVPPEAIEELLDLARRNFEYVVCDLPCSAEKVTMQLLPKLDDLVAVTTGELASLHLSKNSLHRLHQLPGADSKLHVALNRVNKRDPISPDEVEKILRQPVAYRIPNDYFSLHAAGQMALSGEGPVARAIRHLAAHLARKSDLAPNSGDESVATRSAAVGPLIEATVQ
jgi:pilus assembly protein CpaE